MTEPNAVPSRGLHRVTRADLERVLAIAGISFEPPPVKNSIPQPETPELVSA